MTKITSKKFKQLVQKAPSWASKLTEPIEVTGFCDMDGSKITHLSHLLYFTGRNRQGKSASFFGCRQLKVAEGTFHGHVDFTNSSISAIGNLKITRPDIRGNAASFSICHKLKVAEGTFPGFVNFIFSGIETIENLKITKPNVDGEKADFEDCFQLGRIPVGLFELSEVNADESLLEKLSKETLIRKILAKSGGRGLKI